jgi:hypothetical protein
MASIIRIKRSSVSGNPSTLGAGELAYSALTDNGSNGGDRLYIGIGAETSGNAANHFVIGGKFFTDRLDHTAGTLTASSALVVDASSKIDNLKVDNLDLNGNTISSTDTNGNILLTPNGTGKTVITNPFIGDDSTSLAEFIYDTVGGAVTGGTGITVTNNDGANTSTISISNTTVSGAGTPVGSSTAIPVITFNAQGQLTAVSTASITTTLGIAGDTGTDSISLATDTLTFTGGTGITSAVNSSTNTVAFDIDNTVVTLDGTQTLTNKTLTSPVITGVTVSNLNVTDSSITFEGATANDFETTLSVTDPTADRTITFPDASGTVVLEDLAQTLTNKTISGSSNTLSNIGNSSLTNSSVTIGSTTVSLGGTSASLAGLTSATFAGSTSGTTQILSGAIAGTSVLTLPVATDTLVGKATTDTFTNKSISGSTNTLSDIGNSSLTNSSVTIGSTSVSLGATVTTFAGLSSVTSTTFVGALTGNASTATTLATPRAINGVNFDGSADITVTADANTLTGTTLKSTVVTSSLTSVGTITTGVWEATDIGVAHGGTGSSTGSITGTGALTFTAGGSNTNVNLVPQGTGTVDVNGARISGLGAPTQDTDAATKLYVDTVAEGLSVKPAVRAATTANITATYANGTAGVGATLTIPATASLDIDGVTNWAQFDGILIKNQTSAFQNGRYYVSTVGNISTAWVLTRCAKCDEPTEIPSMYVFVQEGTTYASTGWVATVEDFADFDVGVDDITFTQFSGAGTYLAGNGLTITGSTFNVVGTADRITANADSVDIASTYVGQSSITTLGTIGTGVWQGTVVGPTYGGTGVNNGSKTITLGGSFTHTGAHTLGLTTTANTSVTLPTTGTLATLAGTESLSNKTITSSSFSGTTIAGSGLITFTDATDAGPLGTAAVVMSGGLSVAKKIYVGTNIIGAGAETSTLDGFNIDGGTY